MICTKHGDVGEGRCLICRAAYQKKWRQANKDQFRELQANARTRRAIAAKVAIRHLKDNPCTDCGGRFHFSAMDFDHLSDKRKNVSILVTSGRTAALEKELTKCELVCANCHRLRTWKRTNDQP